MAYSFIFISVNNKLEIQKKALAERYIDTFCHQLEIDFENKENKELLKQIKIRLVKVKKERKKKKVVLDQFCFVYVKIGCICVCIRLCVCAYLFPSKGVAKVYGSQSTNKTSPGGLECSPKYQMFRTGQFSARNTTNKRKMSLLSVWFVAHCIDD